MNLIIHLCIVEPDCQLDPSHIFNVSILERAQCAPSKNILYKQQLKAWNVTNQSYLSLISGPLLLPSEVDI